MEIFSSVKTQVDTGMKSVAGAAVGQAFQPAVQNVHLKHQEENVQSERIVGDISKEHVAKVIDKLNQQIEPLKTNVQFGFSDAMGQMIVTVSDKNTGRVIRQLPSKEALELAEKMKDIVGMIFDAKA
jgi:flagellar protein FlaG